VDSNLNR